LALNEEIEADGDGSLEPEISKSQRKRDAYRLLDLATELVDMPAKKLEALSLPETVLDAVAKCPPASTRGARKRQLQFIGKLLRKLDDADTLLDRLQQTTAAPGQRKSKHLDVRNQLIHSLPETMDLLRQRYPDINLQQVRQLVRKSQAESAVIKDTADPDATTADTSVSAPDPRNTAAAAKLLKLLEQYDQSD